MPVRTIPKNYRNLTGLVANTKVQRMTAFESTLEKDFFLLLDFDPAVRTYEEQPVAIAYWDEQGKRHTYTPDVLVRYRNDPSFGTVLQPRLCEVKYRDDLCANWSEYKTKFRAAWRYAKAHGWRFRLVTEREIRTPYLGNVRFLRQYRKLTINPSQCRLMLTTLAELRQTDPERLLMTVTEERWVQAQLLTVLWHLVACRRIGVNLSQPLTMHSPLWPVELE